MNLRDANQLLLEVDCRDPDAAAAALTDRARALAEFAASAPKELLEESLAAGNVFRERLEIAQRDARRELERMTALTRGLQSTLDQRPKDRVTCFG